MPKTPNAKDNKRDTVSKVAKPTVPEPFNMPGEVAQKKHHEKFEQLIQKEKEQDKDARNFKANAVPKIYPPTYAQRAKDEESTDENMDACTNNIIRNQSIQLASDRRAKERAMYEEFKRKKQEQDRLLKQLQDDVKRKQEQAEIQMIRRQAEYRANPFTLTKQEFPKIQPRPTTTAITPNILKRTFNLFSNKKPKQ